MATNPSPNVGSYCLVRQSLPKKRWKNPEVPEYAPNWIVSLRMTGGTRTNHSAKHPICAPCLACTESPAKARPECRCQKPARDYGDAWLKRERASWNGVRLDRLQNIRRHKDELPLQRIFEVYKVHGPSERLKTTQRATHILEEATGTPLAKLTTATLQKRPADLILKWAAMRQVYAERGWDARSGSAPVNAWAQLRREWEDGTIQRNPDRLRVRAVNTTITGYIRDLKSIFSNISRTNYLPGLDIPELRDLATVELALPKPKGFRRIEPAKYEAMWGAAQKLHGEDLQAWVALQLAWRTGLRTIELKAARPHWLEVRTGNANAAQNGTFLRLQNRPEEGFYLKAKYRGMVRDIRLPQDLVDAINSVKTTETLLGVFNDSQASDLLRRVSAWIRQFVPDGPHTLYWFRHLAGALRYTSGDIKAAGALLGHAPGSSVTGDTYIDLVDSVNALTDDELHPDKMGLN